MSPPSSSRRKRVLGKKPGTRPTLVQSGQSVAIGGGTASGANNQYHARDCDVEKILDGFLLLERCRVEFPDEVTQAVLSELNIHSVVAEDLLFFSNLSRLDMSDNEAPFEPFGSLPALVELDLQCNAIQSLSVPAGGFLNLEILNLSFNCLATHDIEELAGLLRIRELYLGNNRIRSVPPVMDRFSRLETLSLEGNAISGADVFAFVAMMPRLRNLNLSHNKITHFPESALSIGEKRGSGFPLLTYLNLAHNVIADESAVFPTCELRSLRKLILYGNPIAHSAVSSSDPSLLLFDPLPNMTAHIAATRSSVDQSPAVPSVVPVPPMLTVIIAYPDTKKKRRATYEDVEIYKMIPNQVPLQPAFRSRATSFLLGDCDHSSKRKNDDGRDSETTRRQTDEILIPQSQDSVPKELRIDPNDNTFLTGVGIEDELMESVAMGISAELPAVPASFLQRSLAVDPRIRPTMNSRVAINALRYQLQHPLTSHDDSELCPPNFQKPTQTKAQRRRRRQLPQPNAPESTTRPPDSTNSTKKDARESRSRAEFGVDEALDSLISTAKKINIAYSPKARA